MLIEVNGRHEAIVELGRAWVCLKDARRSFARWLLRSGKGHRGYHGGVHVYADISDQSMEKAEAYAEAFAEVLRENGIECSVVSAPD
jgi:ribosomal protein L15E